MEELGPTGQLGPRSEIWSPEACWPHLKFSEGPGSQQDHTQTFECLQPVLHVCFDRPRSLFYFLSRVARDQDHTAQQGRFNSFKNSAPVQQGSNKGFEVVLCRNRNKSQHTLNGNTRTTLCLNTLIPEPSYPRALLLSFRPDHPTQAQATKPHLKPPYSLLPTLVDRPLTTPQGSLGFHRHHSVSRSGRRIKIRNSDGSFTCYRRTKGRHAHRIQRINRIHNLGKPPTPPPRGVPGTALAVIEECPQRGGGKSKPQQGATKRAARRRAYRKWRREFAQRAGAGADTRADTPPSSSTQSTKTTQKTSKWYRQALHWQEHMKRNKKPKPPKSNTTPPLAYGAKMRIGALNVQGMADTLKLKTALQLMKESNLDVMMLSETKSTSYYSYISEQHLVILSGNHLDKHAGVGAIIHPRIRPHLADVIQLSSRIIHLTFNKRGGRVHVIGAYAPHSGLDLDTSRQPFWTSLENHLSTIPQPEPVYVVGDFNVRFQGTHSTDMGVLGPYTYGKGRQAIDHTASSNRSLCVHMLKQQNMVEVASYKTPNPVHQITYRDKAAPPSEWSQFILDPPVILQLWSHLQKNYGAHTIDIAAHIRSFLPLEQALPPTKKDPTPDPKRFQRLDHTFTRSQWLSSVNSCRSKLHTGFPTDHYLVVTEVQVKLATRIHAPRLRRPLNLSQVSVQQRAAFNSALAEQLGIKKQVDTPKPLDHTAKLTVFTDGSGTRGRCSPSTPAGWGWTASQGEDWLDACGPVITDHTHISYLGARVGSNNTGELCAIIEAILFGMEAEYTQLIIHSDSQWAINVLTGRWGAKTHKELVANGQRLLKHSGLDIQLHWIKGHSGKTGNERADRLAEEGKNRTDATGGRNIAMPLITPPTSNHTAPTEGFTAALSAAANATFRPHTRLPRTPWIQDATLQALDAARKAQAMQADNYAQLRNTAKRMARKDRVKWVHDQLALDPAGTRSTVWNVMRRQRKGFTGKRNQLIQNGKAQPWFQR